MAIRARLPGNPKVSVPYEFPSNPREISQNFKRTIQMIAKLEERLGDPDAEGQIPVADAEGEIVWSEASVLTGVDADTLDGIDSTGFSLAGHTHDDRYFTEAEVTALLAGKANTVHTHVEADITDLDKYTEAEVDALIGGRQPLDADLTYLAGLLATGILTRTGDAVYAARSIAGTANRVTVTNGSGVGGNPTLTAPQDLHTSAAFQVATLGVGLTRTEGTLHVLTASAGAIAANTIGDDLVIENSDHAGLSILTPADKQARIMFARPGDNTAGQIFFEHAIEKLTLSSTALAGLFAIRAAGSDRMRVDAGGVCIGPDFTSDTLFHVKVASSGRAWAYDGNDVFTLESNGTVTAQFISSNTGGNYLLFSDTDARAVGYIGYLHSTDIMEFRVNGSLRLEIESDGRPDFHGPTATTVGAAGGASALPANPVGYLRVKVGGTAVKIPYYNE